MTLRGDEAARRFCVFRRWIFSGTDKNVRNMTELKNSSYICG